MSAVTGKKLRSGKIIPIPIPLNRKLNNSPVGETDQELLDKLIKVQSTKAQDIVSDIKPLEDLSVSVYFEVPEDDSLKDSEIINSTPLQLVLPYRTDPFENISPEDSETYSESSMEEMAQFDREDFKELPAFHGNPSELPRFIAMVTKMNDLLAENQKVILFNKLDQKLTDHKAYGLYSENIEHTWDSLKIELERAYFIQRDYSSLTVEMLRMSQSKNENVKRYCERVSNKFADIKRAVIARFDDQAAREIIIEEQKRITLNAFKDGLNPELRSIVKSAHNLTLQDAFKTAVEEEEGYNRSVNLQSRPLFQNNNLPRPIAIPGANVKIEPYEGNRYNPPVRYGQGQQKFCTRCQARTHNVNECFANYDVNRVRLPNVNPDRTVNSINHPQNTDESNYPTSKNFLNNEGEGRPSLTQQLQVPSQF